MSNTPPPHHKKTSPESADEHNEDEDIISKTALKKASHDLQDLGVALANLKPEEFATIPLDETLSDAILDLHKIRSNSARKRQMQFIGKLMRNTDYEAVEAAFEQLHASQQNDARRLHLVEQWRDRLLNPSESSAALKAFIDQYHNADRQQLRQLVKNTLAEREKGKPPANARKLFKLLRDTLNDSTNAPSDHAT